ncbi:hypothetical protein [Sphingomonas sp. LT1P40]|uniref:hypothetical protein n=1 Tax=Alteristakelama amylovorans TaxID=3096166 RepID=UPI002FCACD63
MSQFEFFMAFYGLLLGLAVAELLGGFANLLRERAQPKWGVLLPLVALLILVEISATFIDTWVKLQGININLVEFGLPALIGIFYFIAAVIAFPRHLEDWPSLTDYFLARRYWIVGLLIAANLGHFITEIPFVQKAAAEGNPGLIGYILRNLLLFATYIVLMVSRRVAVSIAALAVLLGFFAYIYGVQAMLAGGWTIAGSPAG